MIQVVEYPTSTENFQKDLFEYNQLRIHLFENYSQFIEYMRIMFFSKKQTIRIEYKFKIGKQNTNVKNNPTL